MDQDEGGGSDWPRIVTFLVSQILSEGFAPVSAFSGVGKVFFGRAYRFAISRDQLGVRQVVLLSVSVLNVTDRTRQTLYERGDTVVTFTAQTGRPVNGRAGTNFRFPLFVHFRQVASEDKGSTRTISATHNGDILRRQLQTWVQFGDGFVIPLLNFTEVDVAQRFTVKHQLAGFQSWDIHRQHHTADNGRELEQAFLCQFLVR